MKGAMQSSGLWLCALWACAGSAETVEWERTPIQVTLAVGAEREIRFEGPATVGVPADLVETGRFRAEFANDTAYWLATEPFGARRVKVRLERTGEFVLFDVRAVPGAGGTAEPLVVTVARPEQGVPDGGGGSEDPRSALVALVRHAARLDLAPPRLAAGPADVVAVETARADATALYRHPDAARLRLVVRGQVSRGGLFATTLEAENVSGWPLEFDVRHLRQETGRRLGTEAGFVAVAWTRSSLAPAGEPGVAARLYVVTRVPFDLAVAE
ncbi:MAG: DUF3438 family protein [Gammaproteobacteria bacterium]|nr:DUF3438 family protein [Gammaproteobacteria bacterium]